MGREFHILNIIQRNSSLFHAFEILWHVILNTDINLKTEFYETGVAKIIGGEWRIQGKISLEHNDIYDLIVPDILGCKFLGTGKQSCLIINYW